MFAMLAVLAASSSAAIAQPQLGSWSFLVGHCFIGEAPGGSGEDKHCFEAVFGGQHIRDRHVVSSRGHDVYAGETLYSARGSKVIFTYWNSLGGLGTGDAIVTPDGWHFSGSIHATAAGADEPFTATWRKVNDGYEVSNGSNPKPTLFRRAD